jgi:CRISPR/Cas system-associated endoribonuclease Cas2
MALHLVSYDLDKPEQNYAGLLARLRELGAQRILYSEWFLISPSSPQAIRDDLLRLIDANDRILVVELKNNAGWQRLMIDNDSALAFFRNAT